MLHFPWLQASWLTGWIKGHNASTKTPLSTHIQWCLKVCELISLALYKFDLISYPIFTKEPKQGKGNPDQQMRQNYMLASNFKCVWHKYMNLLIITSHKGEIKVSWLNHWDSNQLKVCEALLTHGSNNRFLQTLEGGFLMPTRVDRVTKELTKSLDSTSQL